MKIQNKIVFVTIFPILLLTCDMKEKNVKDEIWLVPSPIACKENLCANFVGHSKGEINCEGSMCKYWNDVRFEPLQYLEGREIVQAIVLLNGVRPTEIGTPVLGVVGKQIDQGSVKITYEIRLSEPPTHYTEELIDVPVIVATKIIKGTKETCACRKQVPDSLKN